MFSFSFHFSLPLEKYRRLLGINKKRWNLSVVRTSTLFGVHFSLNPFRDSYSNTIFFINVGLFTFDIDLSIFEWK